MKKLAIVTILLAGGLAPASAQSNAPAAEFFGGSTIPVCYWYPQYCKNGRIITNQPVRASKTKRAREIHAREIQR
jgi:hypothetical protein